MVKIGLDRDFEKKNQDFWTKSRYFLKLSRALLMKSQKKNWQTLTKKNCQKLGK